MLDKIKELGLKIKGKIKSLTCDEGLYIMLATNIVLVLVCLGS